jgi:isopentenyl diphosphate isomerase/L-lactate dehydrogenase-like FMN-dependent dehydrogenase
MANLNINAISYYISGAGSEITLKRNRKIYNKILLNQKVLKNVVKINLQTEILGKKIDLPICISPTALQKMAHEDGEMATARSAYKNNTILTISSFSSTSLEDVARENKTGIRWFQLYAIRQKNDKITSILKEVEKNGFSGLVLTVDAPIMGYRDRDFQIKFKKPENVHFEIQKKILSIQNDSVNKKRQEEKKLLHRDKQENQIADNKIRENSNDLEKSNISNINNYNYNNEKNLIRGDVEKPTSYSNNQINNNQTNPVVSEKQSDMFEVLKQNVESGLDWTVINWLRTQITIPIIVKGILNSEDAVLAAENDVDAIIISNHGGRQLDTVPSTIEVLGDIVDKLEEYYLRNPNKKKIEIYIDGGIRRGTDIIKALALGAKAVFIGRPIIWGLAAGGENGVDKVLEILKDELVVAMKLTGCTNLKEINRGCLYRNGNKPKF